jgi:DNA-binding NarL/FixJ family response regulator
VIWASQAAAALLSPELRAQLSAVARRLHQAACGRTAFPAKPSVVTHRLLRVHLSVLRPESDAPLILAELEGDAPAPPAVDELARRYRLTPAEGAVMGQLASGLSNAAIAARLFVSVETVRTHVRRILAKLEVGSRTEAALLAARAR